MLKLATTLLIVIAFAFAGSIAHGSNTYYVDNETGSDRGNGSPLAPFKTILAAIENSAVYGDTIVLGPGIYTGQGNFDLNLHGMSITLQSQNPQDPDIVAATIIDPQGVGRAFYINSGEDPNCIIDGITIRNGSESMGGGIFCYGSSPTIKNCVISNCSALIGGGIYFENSNARVINCSLIANNANEYGGGISCNPPCNIEIIGCSITGNSSGIEGGGIDCTDSNATLRNCVIAANTALRGAGINSYSISNIDITNCTIVGNTATGLAGGIYCQEGAAATASNTILWDNRASLGKQAYLLSGSSLELNYCDVQDAQTDIQVDPGCTLTWTAGNIDRHSLALLRCEVPRGSASPQDGL